MWSACALQDGLLGSSTRQLNPTPAREHTQQASMAALPRVGICVSCAHTDVHELPHICTDTAVREGAPALGGALAPCERSECSRAREFKAAFYWLSWADRRLPSCPFLQSCVAYAQLMVGDITAAAATFQVRPLLKNGWGAQCWLQSHHWGLLARPGPGSRGARKLGATGAQSSPCVCAASQAWPMLVAASPTQEPWFRVSSSVAASADVVSDCPLQPAEAERLVLCRGWHTAQRRLLGWSAATRDSCSLQMPTSEVQPGSPVALCRLWPAASCPRAMQGDKSQPAVCGDAVLLVPVPEGCMICTRLAGSLSQLMLTALCKPSQPQLAGAGSGALKTFEAGLAADPDDRVAGNNCSVCRMYCCNLPAAIQASCHTEPCL